MLRKIIKITILLLGLVSSCAAQSYTISGQIKDAGTGEDLINATVYAPSLNVGAVSNVYGFYSLTLEEGTYEIIFSYLGYEDYSITVELTDNIAKEIELTESSNVIKDVVISAEKEKAQEQLLSTEMSADEVSIETVKKMPALFGEVDIIKTIQLLPGVKTVGEGGSGFYVRGGNVDQNLVLLDEAPIYNASHLLGFFSSFNPDAIKDMKLYKGAIPAIYGGRLSSVLDIRMKEGNSKKYAGSAGIGSLMSRLALEAPVGDKGSFMIAGRRSYLDVVAKTFRKLRGNNDGGNNDGENNDFYFYDLNAKANYRIDRGIFANDELVDGEYLEDIPLSGGLYLKGDSIIVEIFSVGEETINYLIDIDTEVFRDGPFDPPPANVRTNITGDAVGYFIASGAQRELTVVK